MPKRLGQFVLPLKVVPDEKSRRFPRKAKKADITAKRAKKAGELIRSGKDVVTFPEGKRSTTGELNLFKRGSFIIAQSSNIKIVPVAIKGSFRVNPPKSLKLRPGKITLNFGHPINPADFPDFSPEKLANHTQKKVAELLAEIQ